MEMIALTPRGDTKHVWDTTDPDERAQAEVIFKDYRSNGFSAFQVGAGTSTALTEFDPDIGVILFVPLLVGG